MIAQLILGLSILVGLHEAGHMVAAKMFGMRVEKFSIGFPPKIFGFTVGETEYSLGAVPLGGFVKITGMIDESMDTEHVGKDPEPYEFRAKPAWQRLIVMLGGIIVNVITGVIIFIALTLYKGEIFTPIEAANQNGIYANQFGRALGLQVGDKILEVNGIPIKAFEDAKNPNYLLADGAYFLIERKGEKLKIPVTDEFVKEFSKKDSAKAFIEPLTPFSVGDVLKGGNAEKAGIKKDDVILFVEDKSVVYLQDFLDKLQQLKGKQAAMRIARGADTLDMIVEVSQEGKIGIAINPLLQREWRDYGFAEAVKVGTESAFNVITLNIKAFKKMTDGTLSPTDSFGGPIAIAQFYGGYWDWLRFWSITGMLSMVLAFMNLLPIPALDGGHVVFLLYEMVSGKAPSDKFLEAAQKIGMVILLGLMIFVFGNDIFKLVMAKFG
jgi:regulator of sigma E protease